MVSAVVRAILVHLYTASGVLLAFFVARERALRIDAAQSGLLVDLPGKSHWDGRCTFQYWRSFPRRVGDRGT